ELADQRVLAERARQAGGGRLDLAERRVHALLGREDAAELPVAGPGPHGVVLRPRTLVQGAAAMEVLQAVRQEVLGRVGGRFVSHAPLGAERGRRRYAVSES